MIKLFLVAGYQKQIKKVLGLKQNAPSDEISPRHEKLTSSGWISTASSSRDAWLSDPRIKGSSCSLTSSGAWNVHHQPNTVNRKTAYKIPIEAWRQLTCKICNQFVRKRTNVVKIWLITTTRNISDPWEHRYFSSLRIMIIFSNYVKHSNSRFRVRAVIGVHTKVSFQKPGWHTTMCINVYDPCSQLDCFIFFSTIDFFVVYVNALPNFTTTIKCSNQRGGCYFLAAWMLFAAQTSKRPIATEHPGILLCAGWGVEHLLAEGQSPQEHDSDGSEQAATERSRGFIEMPSLDEVRNCML